MPRVLPGHAEGPAELFDGRPGERQTEKLYDDWAKTISEKNGELTEKDIEDFNRRYDEIVAEGLKRRDEWAR